jgi:branched-chain amino acid transport system substrate-binding protein
MQKLSCGVACFALIALGFVPAHAQNTVKIGLIMPYSGQFADTAVQLDNAIKLYMQQHGDIVAGKRIEVIRKDTGGIAPDVAKRLSQELIVREGADILGGFILSPNALAAGAVSAEAKKLMVVMNAATSVIITKSPYITRTSATTPMLHGTLGTWAAKNGSKRVYTMVSDFAPGIEAEGAFHASFKEAGGEIIGTVRFPVANPDFSAFVQRAKEMNPDGIYIWIPGGAQPGIQM